MHKMTKICSSLYALYFLSLIFSLASGRTISTDSEPSLIGNGTYPRATYLNDKTTIVACYTFGDGVNTTLRVASSVNGGMDWTIIGSVASAPVETTDLDNCNIVTLPSGRLLASFRNHDKRDGTWSFYRLTVCYSDDGGLNWKYLSTPKTSATPGLGLWEPFLQNTLSGGLQLYFASENGTGQNIVSMTSTDDGLTWGAYAIVASRGSTTRDGMPGVARLGSGSKDLIAVFESLNPDTGIYSVVSSDDGLTWGNTRLVYRSPVEGAGQAAPQVTYVGDVLVASFQTNEDTLSTATTDWGVKTVISFDQGATWTDKTTVLQDCNWAGVFTVSDDSLLVLCGATSTYEVLAQTMIVS